MINILITSIGGDIGSNMLRILKEQKIFHCVVVGTDIKEYIFCKKQLDKFYKVSKVLNENYKDEIFNIVKENNIELIIPSSEYDIIFLKRNKILFEQLNVKLMINNDNLINIFLDKYETSKALNKFNIGTPDTFLLSEYNHQLNFPILIKACRSTFSKDVSILRNQDEFAEMSRRLHAKDQYIVQKYIGSSEQEYTTTVYRSKETTKVITFRRTLQGDKTGYAEICSVQELEKYSHIIADTFELNGSINIQSRMENGNYYIFEINPRISSTVYIRNHFNFTDLLWWICDLMNINYIQVDNIKHRGIGVLGFTYEFYDDIIPTK